MATQTHDEKLKHPFGGNGAARKNTKQTKSKQSSKAQTREKTRGEKMKSARRMIPSYSYSRTPSSGTLFSKEMLEILQDVEIQIDPVFIDNKEAPPKKRQTKSGSRTT